MKAGSSPREREELIAELKREAEFQYTDGSGTDARGDLLMRAAAALSSRERAGESREAEHRELIARADAWLALYPDGRERPGYVAMIADLKDALSVRGREPIGATMREVHSAFSWTLDLLDIYDEEVGPDSDATKQALHVEAKRRARDALSRLSEIEQRDALAAGERDRRDTDRLNFIIDAGPPKEGEEFSGEEWLSDAAWERGVYEVTDGKTDRDVIRAAIDRAMKRAAIAARAQREGEA